MLSAQFIRENADRVRSDVAARGADAPIDDILTLDERRRTLIGEVEGLRAERNTASKAIGQTQDAEERTQRIEAARAVGERLDGLEDQLRETEAALQEALYEVPNILDPETPPGADESENVTVRTVGEPATFDFEPRPHWEVGEALDGIDLARGAKMSGSRFFVLRGGIARLHRAMIQWMIDCHVADGYVEHYLPYMLTEESFFASGHLPDFRENLYQDAEQDYLFVPTAEAPFANLYRDEILSPDSLPQRLVAHTPCFRREKMSAGRDTRGLKRLHQFEKVEMFVFCEPEESERELQAMVERACGLAEALEIRYRVLQLCAGDIGFKASKAYDVELWSPGVEEWLEVSSVSDTLDFQARRANVRYRPEADARPRFPHLLNGSGLGAPRALISIIENYQQADGSVAVPAVLHPYMGGAKVIEPETG
ncbi:MAG: serine--tRNA ligase [Dehalococcoidia bacterium]|nr:serine--tRNA ligase [Dehalococcoidia bacterium]MYA52408.1 serine--tRNA ligase [Dehalococcoidia bacterium]